MIENYFVANRYYIQAETVDMFGTFTFKESNFTYVMKKCVQMDQDICHISNNVQWDMVIQV